MRHRTLRRALLLPVLGVLTLSACASDDDDDNGSASGNGGDETCITSQKIDAVEGGDSGGGGGTELTAPESGGPNDGKTFKIGFMGPLTGNSPQLGVNIRNGIQLAITQANALGAPYKFELAQADDEGAPGPAPAAAQTLIDDQGVVAVVGPAFSGPSDATGEAFNEAGLVTVSASATAPALTTHGWKTFKRTVPNDNAQGEEVAKFLADHAKKVYVIDDTSEYGVGLASVIKDTLPDSVEVESEGVAADTQDYSAIAQKVVNADVDAIYYAGYYQAAAPFAKALKAQGYECLAMSGDGTNDDQFIELGGADTDGWMLSCPCADARVAPSAKTFLDDYQAEFNTAPGTYSPEAYDSTNAIISAIFGMDAEINRASVLEAVNGVEYTGLTKTIKFQDNGEVEGKAIFVYGVEDGKRVLKGTTEDLLK